MHLEGQRDEAERNAWRALTGYKFVMFGYWAGVWVHLNRLTDKPSPNPFRELVNAARFHISLEESNREVEAH